MYLVPCKIGFLVQGKTRKLKRYKATGPMKNPKSSKTVTQKR